LTKDQLNSITESVIGAALEVHRELGPGLLEQNLKFADCRVGLIINFNVKWLVAQGVKRVLNAFPE
jgi:hypothetical protein